MADDAQTPQERNGKWQHLVTWCLDLYAQFSESAYRKKKAQEIADSVDAYEQTEKLVSEPWEGAHNVPLPLTTISLDNLEPRLVAGLVGKQPYVRFDTDAEPEPEEITELEQWFNDELSQVVKIETFAGSLIHKLLQDGTVFPMGCYDYKECLRRDFMFADALPEGIKASAQAYKAQVDGLQAQHQSMLAEQMQIFKAQTEGAVAAGQEPPPEPMLPEPPPLPDVPEELKPMQTAKVVGGVYVSADGKPLTVETLDKTFEGGAAKLLEWSDVFVPDQVPDNDWEQIPIIHRVNLTYGELQRFSKTQEGWMNIGPWLLRDQGEDLPSPGAHFERDEATVTGKETIECVVCYVAYTKREEGQNDEDVTDWSEDRYVATIAVKSRTLIRMQMLREVNYSNRHIIRRIPMFPESGKVYGTSIFGKMKSIQKMANEVFNMSLNTAEVILIPWFLYGSSVGWKGEKKQLKPGIGIPVDSTKDILFPTFPINPGQFFEYLQFIVQFWERLFNVGDLQIGRESSNTKTATEALAVIQEGNISHNYRSVSLKEGFLELVTVIYDLYYQHLPLEYVWTQGNKKMPIERSKMRRARNFRLTSSTEMSNKLIERQSKEDMWNKVKEGHALGIGNIMEGWTELLKAYNVEDPERFTDPMVSKVIKILQQFPDTGPMFIQAAQEAMAKAQQLTQGAAAGPGGGKGNGSQGVSPERPVQGVPSPAGPVGGGGFARPSDVAGLAPGAQ